MFKNVVFYSLLFVLFLANSLFAQDTTGSDNVAEVQKRIEEMKKKPVLLAGNIYMQYRNDFGVEGEDMRTFEITRAYLQYKKQLKGPLSFHLVTDIGPKLESESDDGATEVYSEAYEIFVKNAYLQAMARSQEYSLRFQFGMLNTPNIALLSKMQGLRWIGEDYSFTNPESINAMGEDKSADMGIKFHINVVHMFELAASLTHGEGYKHPEETNDAKAFHVAGSINVFSNLFINGFFKTGTTDEESIASPGSIVEADASYFAFGLAWNDQFIKIGVNYVMPSYKQEHQSELNYTLYESWINVNTKGFSDYSFLLLGRFAYTSPDQSSENDKYVYGLGFGYEVNNHLKLALYLDRYVEDSDSSTRAYLKSEITF